jgi:hypothetical protein
MRGADLPSSGGGDLKNPPIPFLVVWGGVYSGCGRDLGVTPISYLIAWGGADADASGVDGGDLRQPPIPVLILGIYIHFRLNLGFPFTVGILLYSFSPPSGVAVKEATIGDTGFCCHVFA